MVPVIPLALSAYESANLDALVAVLADDVFISMPPMPFEYEGRDAVAGDSSRDLDDKFCRSSGPGS